MLHTIVLNFELAFVSVQDGRHVVSQPEEKYSPEELKIMKTQDEKYVQMKLNMERKVTDNHYCWSCTMSIFYLSIQKVERLQASLHMTNSKPNSHILFVDSTDNGILIHCSY